MRFFWVRNRQEQKQYNVYWKPGRFNKSDYYTKHHPIAHHRNVRPYYVFDPQQPDKYYSTQVNYYAPLADEKDDDTTGTEPVTDSDTDSSSEEETIVASNCSQPHSASRCAGEGVLKTQSRVTRVPGLSSLVSSATPSGHNIS